MYDHLMHILVYLGRTRHLCTTFSSYVDGAKELKAYADSNWATTRSTTGFAIFLGGAVIAHTSRRQHCITMSSCEAELVALADCAIELIYIRELLFFIGHEQEGPINVYTDNKGAYDFCHRFTSAQNSRHVHRKLFKMREMRGAGEVVVSHVPTDDNPADLFTKILSHDSRSRSTARPSSTPPATRALSSDSGCGRRRAPPARRAQAEPRATGRTPHPGVK